MSSILATTFTQWENEIMAVFVKVLCLTGTDRTNSMYVFQKWIDQAVGQLVQP